MQQRIIATGSGDVYFPGSSASNAHDEHPIMQLSVCCGMPLSMQDFPSLDSPVVQQGFNLGQTAAALGNSITQLRHAEKVQLQQQQQQRQQQGAAKEPQQVQQQKQQRQKPLEQALKTEEQAVLNKQRGASSAKGTAKGSDSSFSSGAAATAGKGAIPAQPSAGRKKRAQIAEDATASAGAAKQGKSAAGGAGPDPPGGAAATAASAGAGKAAAGVGGVKAAPVTSSGMPNPQSPCLVEVKLQVCMLLADTCVRAVECTCGLYETAVAEGLHNPHGCVAHSWFGCYLHCTGSCLGCTSRGA